MLLTLRKSLDTIEAFVIYYLSTTARDSHFFFFFKKRKIHSVSSTDVKYNPLEITYTIQMYLPEHTRMDGSGEPRYTVSILI